MGFAVFVFEQGKPFDYGAFTKYMVKSGNVMWCQGPGQDCHWEHFRKAIEVELGVDTETAQSVLKTMQQLGMITYYGHDRIYVVEKLRK